MIDTSHPSANFNTTRDPKEILYDVVEIKWGYLSFYLVK